MTNITQEDALSGKASMLKVLILLVCGDRGPRGQCRVKTLLNYYAFLKNFKFSYFRFSGPTGREDDVLVAGFITSREEEPTEQINLLESLWPE